MERLPCVFTDPSIAWSQVGLQYLVTDWFISATDTLHHSLNPNYHLLPILRDTTYFLWPTKSYTYSVHLHYKIFFLVESILSMTYPRLRCKHAPGALLLQTDPSVVKRIYLAVRRGKKTLAYVGQMFSFHHCRHVKIPQTTKWFSFCFMLQGELL